MYADEEVVIDRYILLGGSAYYPEGWKDYRDCGDDPSSLVRVGKSLLKEGAVDWWQVVDLHTKELYEENLSSWGGDLPDTEEGDAP